MRSQIVGTGSYAPSRVLTNADLEKIVDTTDDWIVERTGIRQRHITADGEATSDMAYAAAVKALEMADLRPQDVEMIAVGTISPDMPFPATAALVQNRLGNKKAFAFDLSAACAGSLYGLSIADRFIRTGGVKNALIIGAENLSRITDWTDRNTCVLFGDAAGAMVLRATKDERRCIQSIHLHTDGSHWSILHQPGPGSRRPVSQQLIDERAHYINMNGREVYKVAVRALEECCKEALAANHLTVGDVTRVVAHQANKRIIDSTLQRLDIPQAKCWMNLERYGNTSSASLPISLDEASRARWISPGDTILIMAIGAGMSWGAGIIRW